jgi:hypothetical protein
LDARFHQQRLEPRLLGFSVGKTNPPHKQDHEPPWRLDGSEGGMTWSATLSSNRPVYRPSNRLGFVRLAIATYVPRPKRKSKVEDAMKFLGEILRDGEKGALEVMREAKAAGITRPSIKRAKKKAGVKSTRSNEQWWWSLPTEPREASEGTPDRHAPGMD